MIPSTFVRVSLVSAAVVIGLTGVSARSPQKAQTQQIPVFRGTTNVVPVDVRVLDNKGQPITDLKAEDFTVFENGVRQKVDYFSTQALTPGVADVVAGVRTTGTQAAALAPAKGRLFLILLGRGRLQNPSKGVDATLRFVRERLMPQDQVALMAWNRATDFSADRAGVIGVLERFRARHEEIEHEVSLHFTGPFALYGSRDMPPHIQQLIDAVFDPASAAGSRQVLPSASLQRVEDEFQRQTDFVIDRSRDMETFRLFSASDSMMANGMFDPELNMSFRNFVAMNRQTMQDVGNLYAGIDYLRFIEGEKHLIFVTEQGFALPRAEYERDLASLASDARVALDTIQTGGVGSTQVLSDTGEYTTVLNGFQLRALREISDISGGQSSVSNYAEQAYDRILSSTAFGYLLGYTPSNAKTDGGARDIRIEVTRKGAHVAHRRAYVARPENAKYDPRESLATTRIMEAASYPHEVNDLKISAKLLDTKDAGGQFVTIDLTVDGSRIRLAKDGDRYVAALNFAVLCGDSYQKDLGQLWESKDVFVPANRLDEIRRTGLTVTLKVAVKQPPVYVKIIAYDYGSDLVGSMTKRMK